MVNDEKRLMKIIAKSPLEQFQIINSDTVIVDRISECVDYLALSFSPSWIQIKIIITI